MEFDSFCESGCELGEGPIWSKFHSAVFWLDITKRSLYFKSWEGRELRWSLDEICSAIAVVDKHHLMIVGESGIHRFNIDKGTLKIIASIRTGDDGLRSNDGACDANGRFWFGTMSKNAEGYIGTIYCYRADEGLRIMKEGVGIPNTFAWSPDNKRMYMGDSMNRRINVFDYKLETGEIDNESILVNMADKNEIPDGSAIDSEGCLWNAHWDGAKIVRYNPNGTVNQEHSLPVPRPTSCTFGGPGAKYLFVTTAREGLAMSQLREFPFSGSLLYAKTDVTGIINHCAAPQIKIK